MSSLTRSLVILGTLGALAVGCDASPDEPPPVEEGTTTQPSTDPGDLGQDDAPVQPSEDAPAPGDGEARIHEEDPRPEAAEDLAAVEEAFGGTFTYAIEERCELTDGGAQTGAGQFELLGTITGDADVQALEDQLSARAESVNLGDDGMLQARLGGGGTFVADADGSTGTVTWTIADAEDDAYADLPVATCTDRDG